MRFALSLAPMILLAACSSNGGASTEQLGPQATRDYGLNGFAKIELKGSDDVTVHTGPAFAVRAQAPQGVLDRLELSVENGVLKVGRRDDDWDWGGANSTAKITVTLPTLAGGVVAGSGSMTVDRAQGETFDGVVTGSGDLHVAALEAATATLSIAGSGDIDAKGKVGRAKYSIAGSGNIEVAGVEADTLDASVAGSGNIGATAKGQAAVSIIGSGDVTIGGGAKCTVDKIGSGDVTCG
jgi:hypothetical protein